MSYLRRRAMGAVDGPITSPTQVDPDLIIGTVEPKRVACDELPADSPWKRPGQVCATSPVTSVVDFFRGLYDKVATATAAIPDAPAQPAPPASTRPSLLVLVALGGAGYYLLRKKGP